MGRADARSGSQLRRAGAQLPPQSRPIQEAIPQLSAALMDDLARVREAL